jgi:hypothetical protein
MVVWTGMSLVLSLGILGGSMELRMGVSSRGVERGKEDKGR